MALTPSTMSPLGTPMPEFSLTDAVSGTVMNGAELVGEHGTLVMFICNHCPFVVHVRESLSGLATEFGARGIAFVAINSNDVEAYPADAPEHMKALAAELGWTFPFLHDVDQSVAHAFRAACTPDFFLFDGKARLAYRGQFDASRPGGVLPLTGDDLRAALEAVAAGEAPPEKQEPSIGCNIKWRPGNEPEYDA